MNAAAWGLVVLVVVPLLQFPVIIYLSRRTEADDEVSLPPAWGYTTEPDDSDRSTPSTERSPPRSQSQPTRICPRCGTENANETAFTYCRDCLGRLR